MVHSIKDINWEVTTESLHQKGLALVPEVLSKPQCSQLIQNYNTAGLYRKKVIMERYRYGLGEYQYFNYPLPVLIETMRKELYPQLVPIANLWMKVLKINKSFPPTLQELHLQCKEHNQLKPTPLILKYGKGGYNTLHQDLYGEVYFPMQVVLVLSEPGEDYAGGEFVLTEQTPRAQSKATVLNPKQGDMLIFTTHFRPVQGKKGYHRVNMRHGVSELHWGERYTLGIIFHDALS